MYRHSCLIDSFKLSVYLSPLPQNPTGKKKITSITEHLQFPRNLSCLSKFKQRLLLYYANRVTRVTVVFWNVLFTGIPLLVHTELHEWDWKLKLNKNSLLNSRVLWDQIHISYFLPKLLRLGRMDWRPQKSIFLSWEASEAARTLAE